MGEQASQKRMDDLCVKLEDLMANAGSLSIQMENGAGAFQDFTRNTTKLSAHLGQASGAMFEFNAACTAAKDQWEIPRLQQGSIGNVDIESPTGQPRGLWSSPCCSGSNSAM